MRATPVLGKFVAAEADVKRAIRLLELCPSCGFQLVIARDNLGLLCFRQKT